MIGTITLLLLSMNITVPYESKEQRKVIIEAWQKQYRAIEIVIKPKN